MGVSEQGAKVLVHDACRSRSHWKTNASISAAEIKTWQAYTLVELTKGRDNENLMTKIARANTFVMYASTGTAVSLGAHAEKLYKITQVSVNTIPTGGMELQEKQQQIVAVFLNSEQISMSVE